MILITLDIIVNSIFLIGIGSLRQFGGITIVNTGQSVPDFAAIGCTGGDQRMRFTVIFEILDLSRRGRDGRWSLVDGVDHAFGEGKLSAVVRIIETQRALLDRIFTGIIDVTDSQFTGKGRFIIANDTINRVIDFFRSISVPNIGLTVSRSHCQDCFVDLECCADVCSTF